MSKIIWNKLKEKIEFDQNIFEINSNSIYENDEMSQDDQGVYCLDFVISSDSTRLLSTFKKNPAIALRNCWELK